MKSSNISPGTTSTERLSLEVSTRKGSQSCGARGRPRRGAGPTRSCTGRHTTQLASFAQAGAHGSPPGTSLVANCMPWVLMTFVMPSWMPLVPRFHARGYARTSVKAVAARGRGVAPDVVSKYYQSKDKLFAAAMKLPFRSGQRDPSPVAPDLDGMGERLTRVTLRPWVTQRRADLIALARAGASGGKAAST